MTGPDPDRIPGLLALAGVASEGRFGSRWEAVVNADTAAAARAEVLAVVGSGYQVGDPVAS